MKYILILCLLFLNSCATIDNISDQQEIIIDDGFKNIKVIPVEFMKDCKELEELKGNTFEYIMNYTVNLSINFNDCKVKHNVLKKWIEQNNK